MWSIDDYNPGRSGKFFIRRRYRTRLGPRVRGSEVLRISLDQEEDVSKVGTFFVAMQHFPRRPGRLNWLRGVPNWAVHTSYSSIAYLGRFALLSGPPMTIGGGDIL
jgi:hypothetical protein